MNENEHLIASSMKNEKHFPKFLSEKKENYNITMLFYKSKKIN